jgi:divalent metal cation (Fe/Co/Zn/Cd) transporter
LVGLVAGVMIFGADNIISIILVGFTFAITSYFLIKAQLNRLPDKSLDDDINNIGRF